MRKSQQNRTRQVLKILNDRQSDIFFRFKKSKEVIQFKLWYVDYDMYIMSTEKSYAIQNMFLYWIFSVWESMQYCSQVVTPLSWHLNYSLSRATLAFGRKFLAHSSDLCFYTVSIDSHVELNCSSYLPLFAFVYWISIRSVKWKCPKPCFRSLSPA